MMDRLFICIALAMMAGCIEAPADSTATPPSSDADLDLGVDADEPADMMSSADLPTIRDSSQPDLPEGPLELTVDGPADNERFYRWTDLEVTVVSRQTVISCDSLDLSESRGITQISNDAIQLDGATGSISGTCDGIPLEPLDLTAVSTGLMNLQPVAWFVAHSGYTPTPNLLWESRVGEGGLDLRPTFTEPAFVSADEFASLDFDDMTQLKSTPATYFVESSDLTFAWYGSWGTNSREIIFSRCVDGDQRIEVKTVNGDANYTIELSHNDGEGVPQVIVSWMVQAPLVEETSWVLSIRTDGADQAANLFRNGVQVEGTKTLAGAPTWRYSDIGGRSCNPVSASPVSYGGTLSEVLVYEEALTPRQAESVSNYLATKYSSVF